MEMVFETALVSALSGLFYGAMAITLNYPLTLNRMLLFAFLGSTLYMTFSLITTTVKLMSKILSVPKTFIQSVSAVINKFRTPKHVKNHNELSKKVKKYANKVEELSKNLDQQNSNSKSNKSALEDKNDNEVKEVVLNKVKEDKEEEDNTENNSQNSDKYRI